VSLLVEYLNYRICVSPGGDKTGTLKASFLVFSGYLHYFQIAITL
jgi:hypothetical protein